ncbi:hypothetical protein LTR17_005782 [Elasticomyces elasticus]|nr:hypothetical protein LTR17_005782 [Elasticomyces elasticus]
MASSSTAAMEPQCSGPTTFIANLFKLPAELRLQIYSGLLFTKPSRINLNHHNLEPGPLKIDGNTVLPPVMRIAKSIREDAIGLYLQHLQELQIVLAARQKDCATHLKNVRAGLLVFIWTSRYRLEDNRKWMVRVDELVAELGRGA